MFDAENERPDAVRLPLAVALLVQAFAAGTLHLLHSNVMNVKIGCDAGVTNHIQIALSGRLRHYQGTPYPHFSSSSLLGLKKAVAGHVGLIQMLTPLYMQKSYS